jgi:hypothetical protein
VPSPHQQGFVNFFGDHNRLDHRPYFLILRRDEKLAYESMGREYGNDLVKGGGITLEGRGNTILDF